MFGRCHACLADVARVWQILHKFGRHHTCLVDVACAWQTWHMFGRHNGWCVFDKCCICLANVNVARVCFMSHMFGGRSMCSVDVACILRK